MHLIDSSQCPSLVAHVVAKASGVEQQQSSVHNEHADELEVNADKLSRSESSSAVRNAVVHIEMYAKPAGVLKKTTDDGHEENVQPLSEQVDGQENYKEN